MAKILINKIDKTEKLTASAPALIAVARNLAPTESLPASLRKVATHVSKLDDATEFIVTDGEEDNPLTVKFTARAVKQLSALIEAGELETVRRPVRGKNGGKKAGDKYDADDAWA